MTRRTPLAPLARLGATLALLPAFGLGSAGALAAGLFLGADKADIRRQLTRQIHIAGLRRQVGQHRQIGII